MFSRLYLPTCFLLVLSLVACVHQPAIAQDAKRPNIVFMMVDDLGYGDLACYGNKSIKTPNLDALAASGVRFTQAYSAAPVCTPSRTAFMTGRYPARTPVGLMEPIDFGDDSIGMTSESPSIASMLKKRGYQTVLVGKWHLGYGPKYTPKENGFDEFYGFKGGGVDYVSHTDPSGGLDLFLNDKPQDQEGYMTDLLSSYVTNFLKQKHTAPFFLSLQFSSPHWPWQAPGASPYPLGDREWKKWGSKDVYRQMVENLDSAVGQIVTTLKEQGLDSNTLIVFTSDNGGEKYSDMGFLNGGKFELWEGGIRVPAIAVFPGRIGNGIVSSQPIIHMDWTATILSIAGAELSPTLRLDGMDLIPLLKDPESNVKRTFFWRVSQRNQQKAIRDGDWKYLKTERDEFLFDVVSDPSESENRIELQPALLQKLKAKYAEWEKEVLAPIPLRR